MRKFFHEGLGFGIRYGYTIAIHHWHGWFSALNFATDRRHRAFLQTTRCHALALQGIAYQFHQQFREKLEPLLAIARIHLTCRERQCLALSGQGKTFPDIAVILNISPRTVKHYIDSTKAMFGIKVAREACALFLQTFTRRNPIILPLRDS